MSTNSTTVEVKRGYEPLFETLCDACYQASHGKGNERHAGGKPFLDQPIFTIAREHGLAFLTGQAAKKLGEAHTILSVFGENRAIAELFGAIVYTAAAVILLREQERNSAPAHLDDIPQAVTDEVIARCIDMLS